MATKKYDGPRYAYTQGIGKLADDKFDIENLKKGEARLLDSDVPDQKAMRFIKDDSLSEFLSPGAGGGRGTKGGPTAKQASQSSAVMSESEKAARKDATEMKMQERTNKAYEDASKGMKKGGSVSSASVRADGIAQKGKTRGKMC
jgi:hypothetical protein